MPVRVGEMTGQRGATAVEYALMVALIAFAVITTVGLVGQRVLELFESAIGLF